MPDNEHIFYWFYLILIEFQAIGCMIFEFRTTERAGAPWTREECSRVYIKAMHAQ